MDENEVLKVFWHHAESMGSQDPDVIAADYAEDAVVFLNLMGGKPVCGREAIRDMVAEFLKIDKVKIESGETVPLTQDDIISLETSEKQLVMIAQNKEKKQVGTETYWIEDGKIKFESCVFLHV